MNRYFSIMFGALTASTMAMGLGPAGTANATCASAFGFGNSSQCSSSPTTIAIAIGAGAAAHAEGGLGAAVALGNGSFAGTYGWLGAATALGNSSSAVAANLGVALAAGTHASAHAGAGPNEYLNVAVDLLGASDAEAYGGNGNVAVNMFGNGSQVIALGTGNMAMNSGNNSQVWAYGKLSRATNMFGSNSAVKTDGSGTASWAFQVLGDSNIVYAGPGPFAIAGAVFQKNAFITKTKPGIHINSLIAGGAAATKPPATSTGAKHTATNGLGGSKKKHG